MDLNDTLTWDFEQKWSEGSNILGMIVASLVFGIAFQFYIFFDLLTPLKTSKLVHCSNVPKYHFGKMSL